MFVVLYSIHCLCVRIHVMFASIPVGKKTYGRPFVPSCMTFHPKHDDILFTGGQDCLQIWTFDAHNHKLTFKDVSMGKLKRNASVLMVIIKADN